MLLDKQSLAGIYSSFNTVFKKTFEETPALYTQIAMEIPSDTSDENYAWLGNMPSMREWIGNRELQNLAIHKYTIQNKLFEATVAISRNDIEDDKIGVFKPIIQDLAEGAKKLPDRLVFGLLPSAFTELCYDGVPFVSDKHPHVFSATQKGTQSNKGTAKLSPKSYGEARTRLMSLVNDKGEPLYIVPDLFVVSPQNEAIARRITSAEYIINKETNIYKDTAKVLIAPELIKNPEMWFLLCTSKAIKPFIFQNRRKPSLVAKDGIGDDNVFYENQYIYGVDTRCNAGYGLWQLAFGSDGTTSDVEDDVEDITEEA